MPAAVVLLVAARVTTNDRLLATVLQPASAWTMSPGLTFLTLPAVVTTLLPVSCCWCVRYTAIGSLLKGHRVFAG